MKTVDSPMRPVKGDILDDPGFHPKYHNGYEVVKVTLNYETEECWVSLAPLAIEIEELGIEAYMEHLEAHGWKRMAKEDFEH